MFVRTCLVNFIKATALLSVIVFAQQAFAQSSAEMKANSQGVQEDKLYTQIDEEVFLHYADEERNVVRFYFSYTCPYCIRIHKFLESWGGTLPNGLIYQETPVIANDDMSMLYASAHMFVVKYAKSQAQIISFREAIYKYAFQTGELDMVVRLIKDALAHAGFKYEDFVDIYQNDPAFKKQMMDIAKRQEDMEVFATPSITVGGHFLTHLGYVNGDSEKFIELLNGVTSLFVHKYGVVNAQY